jgi:hypothetical protein
MRASIQEKPLAHDRDFPATVVCNRLFLLTPGF